jgi:anti-sigma factor RsiW
MTCPEKSDILRYVSGELSPEQRELVQKHLESCSACSSVHKKLQASWDVLADWRIEPAHADVDVTDRVLAGLDAHEEQVLPRRRTAHWFAPFRAAASIALAVGLGLGAGFLVPVEKEPVVRESAPSLELLAQALDLLAPGESATGLIEALEPDDVPEEDGA